METSFATNHYHPQQTKNSTTLFSYCFASKESRNCCDVRGPVQVLVLFRQHRLGPPMRIVGTSFVCRALPKKPPANRDFASEAVFLLSELINQTVPNFKEKQKKQLPSHWPIPSITPFDGLQSLECLTAHVGFILLELSLLSVELIQQGKSLHDGLNRSEKSTEDRQDPKSGDTGGLWKTLQKLQQ